MSSITDLLNARKRRLQQLTDLQGDDKEGVQINKKCKAADVKPASGIFKDVLKEDQNYTVEGISEKIEREELNKLKETADRIITDFSKRGGQSNGSFGTEKKGTANPNHMWRFLQDRLDELDQKTDDEIKRLVRRRLMKEATADHQT